MDPGAGRSPLVSWPFGSPHHTDRMTASDTPSHADLKTALAEVLRENQEWLREVVQEALVDAANAEARREHDVRTLHARADAHRAFPTVYGRA